MLTVFITNMIVIAIVVMIHYEFLLDCVSFSFTTYTTLGMGDIEPIRDLRYLTSLESLIGLVLITWSASFPYLEMTRYWDRD